MTHQQVNGAKKPYIQFFCVAEAKFLVNSTSQQRIKHYIQVCCVAEAKFLLNSTSQQHNHTTPSPKIDRYKR